MTDKATPQDKLAVLFNEKALRRAERQRDASTFSQFANSEAAQDAGRYAAINKANVVGATPAPQYPAGPNWSADPVGIEPPLGFVDEAPVVGEPHEVQASIERLERAADHQEGLPSHPDDGRCVAAGCSASDSVEPPPNQSPNRRSPPND